MFSCRQPVNALTSGNWTLLNDDFPGYQRSSAISFVIGNNAYLGLGYNQGLNVRFADLYSYGSTGWTQLASAPSGFLPRSNAVAFSIGTNAYVGLGQDNNNNYLQDNWQYNTLTNTWTRKADFAGTARIDASAFGIGAFGYVLCGYDGGSNRKDSWMYDPAADRWTLTPIQFNGSKRTGAIVFVHNSKAYIVTGVENGTEVSDFVVFDPSQAAAPWSALRNVCNCSSDTYDDDYTDIVRDHGVGFVQGDTAYITTGNNAGAYNSRTWGYDFVHDTWFRRSDFEKVARSNAIGFAVGNRGYVATGKSNAMDLDDLSQWFPYQSLNTND